jgi:hypothetical protein
MLVGVLLAVAVAAELALILVAAHDAATLVRIVVGVAASTQLAALATFWWERSHR